MPGYKRGNTLYLNVANGIMRHKYKVQVPAEKEGDPPTEKTVEEIYNGWIGKITDIQRVEGKYEDKPIFKYQITMVHEGEVAYVQFTEDTYYCLGFFQRLRNVDFSKTLLIGVLPGKDNKKISFCYLKQDDVPIKKEENFPQPEKKVQGKKKIEVTIWDAVNEEIELVLEEVKPKINEAKKSLSKTNEDDLPF